MEPAETRKELIRLLVSAFLTVNIMMLSFALYSGFFTRLTHDAIFKLSWPPFIMATVVLFYGGRRIFQKAGQGFRSLAFSMETLIGAGSLCVIRANSSLFWLLSKLHDVRPDILYRTFSVQSLIMGISGFLAVLILRFAGVH